MSISRILMVFYFPQSIFETLSGKTPILVRLSEACESVEGKMPEEPEHKGPVPSSPIGKNCSQRSKLR